MRSVFNDEVPDVARTAHRTDDTVIGHQLLELLAGVLAAAIGMMQQRIGFTPPPERGGRLSGYDRGNLSRPDICD